MANPNVKFDIFHSSSSDNNNPNHYLHHGEASGRRDDTEDDDDEEDEEDELATTDLLKKTKHRDYLAKKLNLASGSFNDSTSSLASSSAGKYMPETAKCYRWHKCNKDIIAFAN